MKKDTGRGQSHNKPAAKKYAREFARNNKWSTIMIKFIRNCLFSFIATDANAKGRFDTVEIGSREGRDVEIHSQNSHNKGFDVGCW